MNKNEIPTEVNEIVVKQINNIPSQLDIEFNISLLVNIIKSKKRLWNYERFDKLGKSLHKESLVEYDHNGIYIYINSDKISLLYLTSLKTNVDFMVSSLYKTNN